VAKLCEGRVAVITGAGRGIGREHALLLAEHGAKVVVNDLGANPDGRGADAGPANEVADLVKGMGGEAVVNGDDISEMDGAKRLIDQAVESFGRLDVLINNAGILRDRMIFSMSEDDWDAIMKVHLKGTFATTHYASAYWREQSKAGETFDARVINTASPSGIYGNVGQTNYGAAKAGIAAFSIIAAMELARYGVTVNCIAPGAITRLTQNLMGAAAEDESLKEKMSPRWIAVLATWLASPESKGVTGRVFDVQGNHLAIAEGWIRGPKATQPDDPTKLKPVIADLMSRARLNADMSGKEAEGPGRPSKKID
jgi:NAD(P)-dependent dehydrogenase (short-subunit alcohol dehydrogenase family)